MHHTPLRVVWRFFLFLLVFALVAGCFSFFAFYKQETAPLQNQPIPSPQSFTVVLDAGHGGEDGGTSSESGIIEKDLNLSIAFLVRDYLEACGVTVVMTRTEDILLYDRTVDYMGRKKALDLAARREIAEKTPNSLFVSIHMNAYPLSEYHGLQVWYSQNDEASYALAKSIQETVSTYLQPYNQRAVKPATSSIYLLHHLQTPAVLVECGFLSNPEEAERLNDAEYQKALAFLIFLSIMEAQHAKAS